MMTRRKWLRAIDVAEIERAIARAERGTTGELRVCVAGWFHGDPRRLGERAFRRLGMTATRHRNGVLILVAPQRRHLVILGDEAIHARVGDAFWAKLADDLAARFRAGEPHAGLLEIIARVGEELARHFPPDRDPSAKGDGNELPNTVVVAPGGRT